MVDEDEGDRDPEADAEDSPSPDRTLREVSLSMDATLDLLANHQRREILVYLSQTDSHSATVDELVEYLMDCHAARTGEFPSQNTIKAQLHHTHIPKLADVGVIEFDERNRELAYWTDDRLERWLQRVQDETDGPDYLPDVGE